MAALRENPLLNGIYLVHLPEVRGYIQARRYHGCLARSFSTIAKRQSELVFKQMLRLVSQDSMRAFLFSNNNYLHLFTYLTVIFVSTKRKEQIRCYIQAKFEHLV